MESVVGAQTICPWLNDMTDITIYSSNYCPYCIRAKQLLGSKGLAFNDVVGDGQPDRPTKRARKARRTSLPPIWINCTHVGGCDDVIALDRSGKLDTMLAGSLPPRTQQGLNMAEEQQNPTANGANPPQV